MASPLLDKLTGSINSPFWSAKAQNVLHDHYSYLSTVTVSNFITVTKFQCTKFEGDFYGLLADLNIPSEYFPYILNFNGLLHPTDYVPEMETVVIPSLAELSLILQVNNTVTI